MKPIFGHIYLYDSSSPFLGRSVADREFLVALIRYGEFAEYHFFYESDIIRDDLKKLLLSGLSESTIREKVRFFHLSDLTTRLASTAYTVFHATDPMLDKLLHMRATFDCCEPFAITGYTHTLSSRNLAPGFLLTLLQKPGPQDAIICSSQCGQEVMHKIFQAMTASFKNSFDRDIAFQGELAHIPLGIELSEYGTISRQDARARLGFDPQVLLLLSIARLTPSSKMDYYPLLDVFARILETTPTARLILAGGLNEEKENYLTELQHYADQLGIAHAVILYPNFPLEHKPLLYCAADVFVSPSDNQQETFGLTIIEALASGLPVVASDWNGYKELIEEGVTGYKIPTLTQANNREVEHFSLFSLSPSFVMAQFTAVDQELLLCRLRELLVNKGLRDQMSARARAAAQPYDWQTLIPRYEALWLNLKQCALENQSSPGMALPFNFHTLFSHYPSRLLAPDMTVAITAKGRDILCDRTELSINNVIRQHLDFQTLAHLLGALAQTNKRISSLASELPQLPLEKLQSHVLWLLKYGALKQV